MSVHDYFVTREIKSINILNVIASVQFTWLLR